jgi:hypothetical protein
VWVDTNWVWGADMPWGRLAGVTAAVRCARAAVSGRTGGRTLRGRWILIYGRDQTYIPFQGRIGDGR